MTINEQIKIIDDKIRSNQAQYDLDRQNAKISALSSGEIDKYEPLDGTHLVAVRGLTTKRYSTQERQREELVGAALLRPIRTNRSSLICRCQFPNSR